MTESRDYVQYRFEWSNEYGDKTIVEKTIPCAYMKLEYDGREFNLLLEEFKKFLLTATFTEELVDRIKYVPKTEEEYNNEGNY